MVDLAVADFQSKPDLAASIVREWFDRDGVDAVVDIPSSSAALAVNTIARERDKTLLVTSAGTTALTGDQCSPNTIQWCFSTYMNARSTGGQLTAQGGATWFIVAPDMAFGHQLAADLQTIVGAGHGKVLEVAFYSFPGTTDFSSLLLRAQASGAKVIALANSGADTVNSVKQAQEFGLPQTATLATLGTYITDIHALGLEAAQGLIVTELFYWDLNDRTRAFSSRLRQQQKVSLYPNSNNASTYSAVYHYLRAVSALGPAAAKASGMATVRKMKEMPTDDDALGAGSVRVDGRHLAPSYLFRVKTPAESKSPWDCYSLLATTPAADAFQPTTSACFLINNTL